MPHARVIHAHVCLLCAMTNSHVHCFVFCMWTRMCMSLLVISSTRCAHKCACHFKYMCTQTPYREQAHHFHSLSGCAALHCLKLLRGRFLGYLRPLFMASSLMSSLPWPTRPHS